jgi:hypothetical protein
MPTAVDLVTDLPADFEVFGQAVATSMADLLGGTTGQILSKTTSADMDFTWITNDVGDITAVTAGTGISGGGTSGAVTITNSMATEITAKGDLIAGTGSATFDNLPVGTNGQTLVADSTASTGLKWATPAASTPTFVGCKVTAAGNQSIANATAVYINFTTTAFETDATFHDTVTNNTRITIPTGKTGYYEIYGVAVFADAANGRQMWFLKNGAIPQLAKMIFPAPTGYDIGPYLSTVAYLTAGDYIEMGVYQVSGGAINVVGTTGVAAGSQFGVTYLGA